MRALRKSITSHQRDLKGHPLFELLATTRSAESLAGMARALAWLPLVFQDVLRLNTEKARGSAAERFVEYHRAEDAGNHQWFLDDLRMLGVDWPDPDELFAGDFEPMRDACYALIGETHACQSGAERIALLLALRATGHVFFEHFSIAAARVCPELPLRYFGRAHLETERDHELFRESTDADLDRMALGEEERARADALVGRVHGLFGDVFSYLVKRSAPLVSDVRELRDADPEIGSLRYARGS